MSAVPQYIWWSYQYGRNWLHLCIADALSSPSFQISGGVRQRSAESRGFSPGAPVPVSSQRQSWQGGLG